MKLLNKHLSTPRVRKHRARKALKARFSELLFTIDDTEQMFTVSELLESLILEQTAYHNP